MEISFLKFKVSNCGTYFWVPGLLEKRFKTRPKKIRVSELKRAYCLGHLLKTCVNSNPKGRRFGARNRKEPLLS